MSKIIFAFTFLLCLSNFCIAQERGTEQIPETKWERYAVKEQDFSVLLPKLPIVIEENDYSKSEIRKRFGAYSDGVAYVVGYSTEAKENPFKKYGSVEPFSEKNLAVRLEQIRKRFENLSLTPKETKTSENGWDIFQLSAEDNIYKIYFDKKRNDWIELWAMGGDASKIEVKRFLTSIDFSDSPQGKEIGEGANATIGDVPQMNGFGVESGTAKPESIESAKPESGGESVKATPLKIILQPRPGYTEEARKANIQGAVRVRVTFSKNGSITGISPVTSLPHGLTEKAIAAARKILFLPAKKNETPVSITKMVEYRFSMY